MHLSWFFFSDVQWGRDARTHARPTDNLPWHKLDWLWARSSKWLTERKQLNVYVRITLSSIQTTCDVWEMEKLLKWINLSLSQNVFISLNSKLLKADCFNGFISGKWLKNSIETRNKKQLISFHIGRHILHICSRQLWKHCGKRGNCSTQVNPPFVTMFSFLFNNYSFLFWIFSILLLGCFQSWQLQIYVCGKG